MGDENPSAGKGGKHLLLPPGYKGTVPKGYYAATPTTNRVLVLLRAIPHGGNQSAFDLIKTVKVHPLNPTPGWADPTWAT